METHLNFQWTSELVMEFTEYVGLRVAKEKDIRQQIGLLQSDFIKLKLASRRVEVKDWEVVAFSHVDYGIMNKDAAGHFVHVSNHGRGWAISFDEALLNKKNMSIHSVRRLSDGETFTVGDSVGWGINGFYQTKIESFRLKDGSLEFKYKMMNFGNYSFVDFIKAANLHKKLPSTPPVEQETIKDDGKSKIVSQFDMYNIGYKDAIKYMDVIISEAERKAFEAARGKVGRSNSDKFSEVTIEDKYPTFSDYIQSLKK